MAAAINTSVTSSHETGKSIALAALSRRMMLGGGALLAILPIAESGANAPTGWLEVLARHDRLAAQRVAAGGAYTRAADRDRACALTARLEIAHDEACEAEWAAAEDVLRCPAPDLRAVERKIEIAIANDFEIGMMTFVKTDLSRLGADA